jgi:MFS family permease
MIKAMTKMWNTLSGALAALGRHRPYGIYPLLSYIVLLIITFTVVMPLLMGVLEPEREDARAWAYFLLVVYLAYGVLHGIIAFCNVALVAAIAARLDGDDPGRWPRPLARALQRLGLIGLYSMVSASLGLVSLLARTLINPVFGGVIAPLLGDKLWVRWRQLSYNIPLQLAVPIIALERPAPRNLFQRGERLVKETWGERVKPAHSISLLALLVLLPILLLFAIPTLRQGVGEGDPTLIWLGLSVMLISIGTYTHVSALVNALCALAAYRYATARKSDLFPGDPSYAEQAFVKPKNESDRDDDRTAPISDASSIIVEESSD